jgi:hypothetical protein
MRRYRGWCLSVVALLGILTMPVEHRGPTPHAHPLFQVWVEAAHAVAGLDQEIEASGRATLGERLRPDEASAALQLPADDHEPKLSPFLAVAAAVAAAPVLCRLAQEWQGPLAPSGLRPRPATPPPRRLVAPR